LLSCGTRSVIDAVFDPASVGELDQAHHLAGSLRPGMLLLADRNYAAASLITTLAATGAQLLIRCKNGRKLPILRHHHDGSWLSIIGGLPIRVIDAQITITTTAGTHTSSYRLLSTLLNPATHPAAELIRIYHQRWEIEVRHPWCTPRRVGLSSRMVSFLLGGLCPAGAGVVAAWPVASFA
jgi:hypothetical protein